MKSANSKNHARKSGTANGWMINAVDRSLSIIVFVLVLPLFIVRGSMALILAHRLFEVNKAAGADNKSINLLNFSGRLPGKKLAHLINLLKGELAWLGPNPQRSVNFSGQKPGLYSPAALRESTGIIDPYQNMNDAERIEIPDTATSYLGQLTRCLCMSVFQRKELKQAGATVNLLNVSINNINLPEALDWIADQVEQEEKTQVSFVNAHCFNISAKDKDYLKVLQNSHSVLPDGTGIRMACRFQGLKLKANLNGTDLFPHICRIAATRKHPIFLLGAAPGVAEEVAKKMTTRYPDLQIAGTHHGFFSETEEEHVVENINASGAKILLVAMGVPMQEKWIATHKEKLQTVVNIGVGGLFDFYAERISRSPVWLREMGLEWIWRLLQEPARMWKRYIVGNPLFVVRAWMDSRKQKKQQHPSFLNTKNQKLQRYITSLRRSYWLFTSRMNSQGKRIMDILIASSMLIILSPLFAITALLIRIESPGAIFFQQTRIGLRGKDFAFWKFRSMYIDAEKRKQELLSRNEMQGGVIFKMKDDPRITRVGKIIRRYSIDELPQLWNVLRGDMSLVGPRPALPAEVAQYSLSDRRRLIAAPGITCTWQVSGRSDIPFDQQVQMDVDYIYEAGLNRDIKLLVKTVPAVISGRGAY